MSLSSWLRTTAVLVGALAKGDEEARLSIWRHKNPPVWLKKFLTRPSRSGNIFGYAREAHKSETIWGAVGAAKRDRR